MTMLFSWDTFWLNHTHTQITAQISSNHANGENFLPLNNSNKNDDDWKDWNKTKKCRIIMVRFFMVTYFASLFIDCSVDFFMIILMIMKKFLMSSWFINFIYKYSTSLLMVMENFSRRWWAYLSLNMEHYVNFDGYK